MLAAAGLPILGRYLLLPAAILAIFCGAGAFGWACLPRGDPRRRPWAWFGVATLVLLVVFTPAQVDRVRALRHALARQDAIQADLAALVRIPPAAIRARARRSRCPTTGRSRCSRSGSTRDPHRDRLGPGAAARAAGHG